MIFYVDTSIMVTAITGEPQAEKVQAWLDEHWDSIAISDWLISEAAAAFSKQERMKWLRRSERLTIELLFERRFVAQLPVLSVRAAEFKSAAQLCREAALGLRAGDALHLAIALNNDATLVTRDKRQSRAASTLHVKTELLV